MSAVTRYSYMGNASDNMCCLPQRLLSHLGLRTVTSPLKQHVLFCSYHYSCFSGLQYKYKTLSVCRHTGTMLTCLTACDA